MGVKRHFFGFSPPYMGGDSELFRGKGAKKVRKNVFLGDIFHIFEAEKTYLAGLQRPRQAGKGVP
jgi:hypothetical protein